MALKKVLPKKIHVKVNDKVKVTIGKDKGKVGKVLKVLRKNKGRAIVENVNIIKRHLKPNAANPQGGIVEKEASIHVSNLMLVCNSCLKPARFQMKMLEDGKKIRICKKCKEAIDA